MGPSHAWDGVAEASSFRSPNAPDSSCRSASGSWSRACRPLPGGRRAVRSNSASTCREPRSAHRNSSSRFARRCRRTDSIRVASRSKSPRRCSSRRSSRPWEVLPNSANLVYSLHSMTSEPATARLSYLQRFPVDIIKIDRQFIDELDEHPRSATLARMILQLTSGLDMVSVAEGIERPSQLRALKALGCNLGQGSLLSEPLGGGPSGAVLRCRVTIGP